MDLRSILKQFSLGNIGIEEVQKLISVHSIEHVQNIAQLDIAREIRRGLPEVIYADAKQYKDIVKIALCTIRINGHVIISKARKQDFARICNALKKKKNVSIEVGKNSTSLLAFDRSYSFTTTGAKMGIMAAGTSDIGIAEEARLVAKAMGCESYLSYDVGIAGIHRLFPPLKEMMMRGVDAIVVVAGMEGALASAVSSLVDVPVIGVPTSVGYGFGSNGVSALASMLQSCTLGLAVVNIDNGIGAGAFAASVANRMAASKNKNDVKSSLISKR